MERIEAYPYHRIKESAVKRLFGKRGELFGHLKKLINLEKVSQRINLPVIGGILFTPEVLLLSLLSFVMARASLLGELLPFMFAFVVAFSKNRPLVGVIMVVFAGIGLLVGGDAISVFPNIITLLVLLGVINNIKPVVNRYWWALPLLSAATIFLVKSILLVASGVSFYEEMVIVFESVITGILTFVFMAASDTWVKKKSLSLFTFEDVAAFLLLGVGIILGLNGIEPGGLSISSILCRLGIMVAALLWGAGQATMVGVVAGMVPSISSSIFTLSLGLYTVSGLLSGAFRSFGKIGIIIGFMLGTIAFCLFLPETEMTVLGIWETAIAAAIFFILPDALQSKVSSVPALRLIEDKETPLNNAAECLKNETLDRVRGLARVFDEIASTLDTTPKVGKFEKENSYLNYLYDEISSGFCQRCTQYEKCWDKYCYKTSKEILDLFTIAEKTGNISYEDCSSEFRRSCLYSRDIVNLINYLFASLRLNEYWKARLDESCGMVSNQIHGISKVIGNLADDYDDRVVVDYNLKERLKKEFRGSKAKFADITPIKTAAGQTYIKIKMNSCVDGEYCENQAAPAISSVVGEKMEVVEKKCPCFMGKGNCEFTLSRACTYRVSAGVAQLGKEAVCGDSFTIATLKENKELIALSDGMGVGQEACKQSQSAVRMLETLFDAGFDKEVALNTINSTLLLKSSRENFATLDITMVDLYTGEVDFIKTGSVPSFIKRGSQVGVIQASSLPVGIVEHLDVFMDTRRLMPRDLLVMVSDGILDFHVDQSNDSSGWIMELLRKVESSDPQLIAEMILNRALSLCKGKPYDDMTVICISLDLNLAH